MANGKNKGCLIGVIIFLIFIVFTLILFFSIKSNLNPVPVVKGNSVLVLKLSGEIPEYSEQKSISDFIKPKVLSYTDIFKILKHAKNDKKIKGLCLEISNPVLGFGKIEEIIKLLSDFKKSGKFIYSFIDISPERGYWLALPSDKIFMPESGYLEVNGFRVGGVYFKDLLSKLGIEAEVVHIGKYKSAGDIFKRTSMSDADREQLTTLLNEIYDRFVSDVSHFRKIKKGDVESIIEKGVFLPNEALKDKLIDGFCYEEGFFGKVKKVLHVKSLSKVSGKDYLKTIPFQFSRNKIAVVVLNGGIGYGKGGYDPLIGKVVGSDEMISIFKKIKKNRSIKGMVLRINSPGGSAIASDLMWNEIREINKIKPVVASMSDVAASGGYYVSVACRKIVADPLTITGSIGVISIIFNLENLYKKLGINVEVIKKGKWADFPTVNRAMTKEEWEKFREGSENFYKVFVNKVAIGRNKTFNEIDSIGRGRVWSGEDALKNGLVDELGGLNSAIKLVRQEAGLQNKKITVVFYPKKKTLFDILMNNIETSEEILFSKKTIEERILERIKDFYRKPPYLYLMGKKIEVE